MDSFLARRHIGGLTFFLLLVTIGCSTAPRQDRLVPTAVAVNVSHSASLDVTVEIAPTICPSSGLAPEVILSSLTESEFAQMYQNAAVECIRSCRLYRLAKAGYASELLLEVTILRISGWGGARLLVTRWRLRERGKTEVLHQNDITTSVKHDPIDSGGGQLAQRSATEDAVAENIKRGVEWLARRTDGM